MHLVSFHISYEFEYFYQFGITFWDLRDSRGSINPFDLKLMTLTLRGGL